MVVAGVLNNICSGIIHCLVQLGPKTLDGGERSHVFGRSGYLHGRSILRSPNPIRGAVFIVHVSKL